MRKIVLAALLALLAACSGLLPAKVAEPTEPVADRTYRVVRTCLDPRESGTGSGVDVGGGYIATARHVANGPNCSFDVIDRAGNKSPAVVMSMHPLADVATLKVERETAALCFRQPAEDEHVTAIGYPKGKYTVTDGDVIGMLSREDQTFIAKLPVNNGSSGGGVWTDEGCLAGISVAKFGESRASAFVSSRAVSDLLP